MASVMQPSGGRSGDAAATELFRRRREDTREERERAAPEVTRSGRFHAAARLVQCSSIPPHVVKFSLSSACPLWSLVDLGFLPIAVVYAVVEDIQYT